jgi:hypothetical protein
MLSSLTSDVIAPSPHCTIVRQGKVLVWIKLRPAAFA